MNWQNLVVKHIDYLSRLDVKNKNGSIIDVFDTNLLKYLKQADKSIFEIIKNKIKELATESYQPKQEQSNKATLIYGAPDYDDNSMRNDTYMHLQELE